MGCGRVHQTLPLHAPQIFQKRKSDANKQDFEIKLNLTDQARSTPKIIGILTEVFRTSSSNLVLLAWTGDALLCEQAQNGVNFDFKVKCDLEGQGQTPTNTIWILTKVFYTYDPNLVILAWTGDELSADKRVLTAHTDGRTHRQTDEGNDNTRRPKLASGKNEDLQSIMSNLQSNCCLTCCVNRIYWAEKIWWGLVICVTWYWNAQLLKSKFSCFDNHFHRYNVII